MYERHVFYVRGLDPATGQAGRIILEHRTGLCPMGAGERAAEFARTHLPPGMPRQCNQIDIDFRNATNCPLHGYYHVVSDGRIQVAFVVFTGIGSPIPTQKAARLVTVLPFDWRAFLPFWSRLSLSYPQK
jgi:hypothetical protein